MYNYRLTRARRMVECVFGILCNKWRIFHCAIDFCPEFSDVIVKTCCILHNFFRQRDGFQFQHTLYECPLESIKAVGTRSNVTGTAMREYFAKYSTSPLGSVLWQYKMVWSTNTENACTFSGQTRTSWQHSTWYYYTLISFTSTCWLQGVLYFLLLRNAVKVYKKIIKEYSAVSINKLQWT
jgi:hypothetical protein